MTATSRRAASGVVRGAGGEPYDGGVSAAWRATKASQEACSAGVGLRSAGGGDRLGSAPRRRRRPFRRPPRGSGLLVASCFGHEAPLPQ